MKIRFGPAGIPLSCKGRTFSDGLEDIYRLDLNAMEIQLVRGIGNNIDQAAEVKDLAKKLDVDLYVHAPYYMDLAGDKEEVKRSMDNIKWAGKIAHEIGAKAVCTYLGLYGRNSKKATMEKVVKNVRTLRDWFKKHKYKIMIGLEMSGKEKVFGTVDEILTVCKRVSGTMPVLNFAHIHARDNGRLKKKQDFQDLFDETRQVTKSAKFYTHFSGVEHENGNRKSITPIKKGDMRFEPLGDCILDNDNYNITIISASPLLEHDAMYMKVIFDRLTQKRLQKEARVAETEKKLKAEKKSKPAKRPKKGKGTKSPTKPKKGRAPKKPTKPKKPAKTQRAKPKKPQKPKEVKKSSKPKNAPKPKTKPSSKSSKKGKK